MIRPVENYVVLEEVKSEEKTTLDLGDNPNLDRPNIAVVRETGPTAKVLKENKVLFLYHMFTEVTIDQTKLLIGKDEGIIAYVD